jgi:glyoxylase-like metal-dependent hydrolase (beta-lactamase superfamily II)
MAYNTNLGDVAIETTFADYQDAGNVKLPARLSSTLDKYAVTDITITRNLVNAAPDGLAAPAGTKPAAAPVANVTVTPLGAGLWFLSGQSHNSVLAEFADHLTLVEVPQNDTRALAVIAKAREVKPDKPLTQVVVTHHHFDHSGGLRAAVSEGLTIVTHESNRAVFEELAKRKHSIVQDALAKSPKDVKIETVGDEKIVEDKTRRMEIYRLANDSHVEAALLVYFPKERALVSADSFSAGWPSQPWAPNLLANVESRKLRVETHVPVHGMLAKSADVAKLASGQKPNATN